MVYVVERYLPGVSRARVLASLEDLARATRGMRHEGTSVRYLSSTIVPAEEACFCQFDAPSEEAVVEANRRAGLAFDRIVAAIAVSPPANERGTQ
jgi:hypothetical protein